jgi:hypothetical protein
MSQNKKERFCSMDVRFRGIACQQKKEKIKKFFFHKVFATREVE